jgi:hypothetical protein
MIDVRSIVIFGETGGLGVARDAYIDRRKVE